MNLFFVELASANDHAIYTGGALLIHANDPVHARGVADEYILAHGMRAEVVVKEARPVRAPEPHDATVLDAAVIIE